MKKAKILLPKAWVIVTIILTVLVIDFVKNRDVVSQDDLGNTCHGNIVKVCGY